MTVTTWTAGSSTGPPTPIVKRIDSPPSTTAVLSSWWQTHKRRLFQQERAQYPNAAAINEQYEEKEKDGLPWDNPLRTLYHPNPLKWDGCPDHFGPIDPLQPDGISMDFTAPAHPVFDKIDSTGIRFADLPKLEWSQFELDDVEMLQQGDWSMVFRARMSVGDRLIKVFPPFDDHFERETQAYMHFLSDPGSFTPYVPYCFGWFEFNVSELDESFLQSEAAAEYDWLSDLVDFAGPRRALVGFVTEYVDGQNLCTANISVAVAARALDTLAAVHRAGVLHNDAEPRHFLLTPLGEVKLIDFDRSYSFPHENVNRLTLWREMNQLWGVLFEAMLPDKKIGIVWV